MAQADDIATGLSKIGLFLRGQAWQQAGARGLTPTQTQILVQLVRRGPARVGTLAEALAVTQPTASDAVAALVRKGYVEKRADPADGRAARLHPTAPARRLVKEVAAWPDALLEALDLLDPAERGVLLKALMKMIRALQQRGAIPLQQMCVTCRHFRPDRHPGSAKPHHCAFVDAAFGDAALRLECGDHQAAEERMQRENWARFAGTAAE